MRRELILFISLSSLFAAPGPIATSIPYFASQAKVPIQSVAVDPAGNVYITGTTTNEIPLVNALQSKFGGGNCSFEPGKTFSPCPTIFVAKFDPTGTKLIYSTYLGGDQSDYAAGIAVDAEGNAYVAGTTRPPSQNGMPATAGNAFVKKLNPSGSALIYTLYIGGNTTAAGIAVDSAGNAGFAGYNLGPDFPSVHPLPQQPSVKSLYVTNDGGKTWRAINNGLPATTVNFLAIDPATPSTLYAATSGGLYKSTNAGGSWTRLLPDAATANTVVVDPRHPSTVYVIYGGNPTLYLAKSTDAGATWTNISNNFPAPALPSPFSPIGAFTIDPTDSNTLWAIAIPNRASTVIKSTDAGDHWQVVYTFPSDIFVAPALAGQKLLIDPKNHSRLYACCIHDPSTGTGGVYRSDDGGNTWTQGATGPHGGPVGILSPWLDPHDSSILYGDWYYGLQRSTDAGMSWAAVALPPGLADHGYEPGGLALDAAGTLNLLNDFQYLIRSSDSGASWTKIDGPWAQQASILAIDPTTSSTMYIASGASSLTGTSSQHAFAAKLDPFGVIQWSTLLGGSGQDQANAVALDAAGNLYVTGKTNSDDFPVVKAFQPVRGKSTIPTTAAFLTKISTDGSDILYSSFLGGMGLQSGNAVAVDLSSNAYVAGASEGGGFPSVAPLQPQPASSNRASFIAKVDATGARLLYSTVLTGSAGYPATEQANAVVVDPQGRALVAGITGDTTFTLVNPIQPTFALTSTFIARLSTSGDSLDFSTYLGDSSDSILAVAPAPNNALWIAGNSGLSRIDFQPPSAQPGVPQILEVYNAASYRPGDTVAPGEIVTLIGQELAPAAQSAGTGSLPRTMQGVTVSIGSIAAPLLYVSPGQINFQVPVETPLGSGPLVVQRGTQASTIRNVTVVASAPGIFLANGAPLIVHSRDFSLVTAQDPAHPGEYLSAFCTGLGATNPPATSGQPAPGAAPTTASVFVYFIDDGMEIPVSYAGLAPGRIGLYQINFRVGDAETPGIKQLFFDFNSTPAITNQAAIWVQ